MGGGKIEDKWKWRRHIIGMILGGIWGLKCFALSSNIELAFMNLYGNWSPLAHEIIWWTFGFPLQVCAFILTSGEMEFHDNYILAFLCWLMSITIGIALGYLASRMLRGN